MKVLDLQCSRRHSFEGWFGSEDDFRDQLSRGLVECPLCADKGIHKLPSAPRLNLGAHPAPDAESAGPAQAAPERAAAASNPALAPGRGHSLAAQAALLQTLRHVLANTEDVGSRFADEARRMHYGEVKTRGIRGQAGAREAAQLLEEGIEVMALPLLPIFKETLQ